MSTAFSTKMAATAQRLISSKGEAVIVERKTKGAMTASGDRTVSEKPIDALGVMLPGDGIELGENETKAAKVLLAGQTRKTEVGDKVVFPSGSMNAGRWTTRNAKLYAPQGVIIYEELEVVA